MLLAFRQMPMASIRLVGFFVASEDFWGKFDYCVSACAYVYVCRGVVCVCVRGGRCERVKWRSACRHQFYFLGQDQSTVAQRAETTVVEYFLAGCE